MLPLHTQSVQVYIYIDETNYKLVSQWRGIKGGMSSMTAMQPHCTAETSTCTLCVNIKHTKNHRLNFGWSHTKSDYENAELHKSIFLIQSTSFQWNKSTGIDVSHMTIVHLERCRVDRSQRVLLSTLLASPARSSTFADLSRARKKKRKAWDSFHLDLGVMTRY